MEWMADQYTDKGIAISQMEHSLYIQALLANRWRTLWFRLSLFDPNSNLRSSIIRFLQVLPFVPRSDCDRFRSFDFFR